MRELKSAGLAAGPAVARLLRGSCHRLLRSLIRRRQRNSPGTDCLNAKAAATGAALHGARRACVADEGSVARAVPLSGRRLGDAETELGLAQSHQVPVLERVPIDALAVDIGAVGAVAVLDDGIGAVTPCNGVTAADVFRIDLHI